MQFRVAVVNSGNMCAPKFEFSDSNSESVAYSGAQCVCDL